MGIDNKKHIIDLKNLSPLIPLSLIKRGGDKERGASRGLVVICYNSAEPA
jgi:hypothetical protein